jgi:hypothetical protein
MYKITRKTEVKRLSGLKLPRIIVSTLFTDNWEGPGYLDVGYVVWYPWGLKRYYSFWGWCDAK